MKKNKIVAIVVAISVVSIHIGSVYFCLKYQQIKSAYWIVHFLNKYSNVTTSSSPKDARYCFVLRDNGNYILNQRRAYPSLIVSYFIENQNGGLKLARINFESWVKEKSNDDTLVNKLNAKLGDGIEIEIK